jgi:uncharacterized protein (TIGR00251 family)
MIINIKVKTNSKKPGIEKFSDYYEVSVKSAPEQNRANLEVIKLLKKEFGAKEVKIIRGHASKKKVIRIE